MRYQRRERRRSAATLIELLSVIAVLAILVTIAIGGVSAMRRRSLMVRTRAEVSALANALEDYKRFYGDYPQLGEFTHATITPTGISTTNPTGNGPGAGTAEAKLFNCLTGVFGPRAFTGTDRVNGPNFLEGSRFLAASSSSLNGTLTTTFLVPTANRNAPPSKVEQNVCLVDPWGNR
jgi:type II secretory pathway pseudopilin PulG